MRYFLWIDDKQQGPFDAGEIRAMISAGEVSAAPLVLPEDGSSEWALKSFAEQPEPLPEGCYFLQDGKASKGPFTIGQMRAMWNAGSITSKTLHRQTEAGSWQPLSLILHLLEPPPVVEPKPIAVTIKPTKSRGLYIILGLLFGCLGIHNFYAGYYGRGFWQLLITVVLGWAIIGIVATGLWSLIEVITVRCDGTGEAMT